MGTNREGKIREMGKKGRGATEGKKRMEREWKDREMGRMGREERKWRKRSGDEV